MMLYTKTSVLVLILLASYGVTGTWVNQVTSEYFHLETPHWDAVTQAVYFVDHKIGYVLKYDPVTKNLTKTYLGSGNVGPILTVEGSSDTFIAGRGRDLIRFRWNGRSETPTNVTVLTSLDQQYPDNYIYGGKADSRGRIWIATTDESESGRGGLYLIEPLRNFTVTKKLTVARAGGLEWSAQDDVFYIADTAVNNVTQYDYNANSATIVNGRPLSEGSSKFSIGGIVVDNSPQMWYTASVTSAAGFVANADLSSGYSNIKISLSPLKVTNLGWGGSNSDTLFVTTSRAGLTDSQMDFYRGSGALFAFTDVMSLHGTPPFKVKLL